MNLKLDTHHANDRRWVLPLRLLLALVVLVILMLVWEWFCFIYHLPNYILPAPSLILKIFFTNINLYAEASLLTFTEAAAGLFLGTILGISIALLIHFLPRFEEGVMTIALLIKSTPMVAIAPLLTIWLGFGMLPKIIITALLAFFPVLINAASGFHALDDEILKTLRSWHANKWEIFYHARLPNALPYLFAAFKVSTPLALIGAVVAEWTGASGGLGRIMWLAYSNLNLPYLFAVIFILAFLGIFIYLLLNWLERKVIFWVNEN